MYYCTEASQYSCAKAGRPPPYRPRVMVYVLLCAVLMCLCVLVCALVCALVCVLVCCFAQKIIFIVGKSYNYTSHIETDVPPFVFGTKAVDELPADFIGE